MPSAAWVQSVKQIADFRRKAAEHDGKGNDQHSPQEGAQYEEEIAPGGYERAAREGEETTHRSSALNARRLEAGPPQLEYRPLSAGIPGR